MEIVSAPRHRGPQEAADCLLAKSSARSCASPLHLQRVDMQSLVGELARGRQTCPSAPLQYCMRVMCKRPRFSPTFGTRFCNQEQWTSMRFIQQAIEVEAKPPIAIVEAAAKSYERKPVAPPFTLRQNHQAKPAQCAPRTSTRSTRHHFL